MENTLLGRCVAALGDAYELTSDLEDWRDTCTVAVLEHLAFELLVLHQQDPRLTVFEIARILREQSHP
jgi:hypothetical protein